MVRGRNRSGFLRTRMNLAITAGTQRWGDCYELKFDVLPKSYVEVLTPEPQNVTLLEKRVVADVIV